MVGNFGSTHRLKYTTMGDVVNIASRLEGLNKYVDSRIYLSDDTLRASFDTHTRPMGRFLLKGKTQGILVHELLAAPDADANALQRYRDAYAALGNNAPTPALCSNPCATKPRTMAASAAISTVSAPASTPPQW